jgi:hypothetical protein
MILADSNVLIDVLSRDKTWLDWSAGQLDFFSASGAIFVNEIIYAEIAAQMASEADLDAALVTFGATLERMPKSAMYLAGRAFARYRKSGGTRTGVLADFFIGAHAETMGLPILTRDVRRYRAYFPKVALVTP